jgi:hypothetical protein
MSFVSANDHPTPVSPQDPLYYAPPSVRNKADKRYNAIQQVGLDPLLTTFSVADKLREKPFADFAHQVEPEFIYDRRRPRALIHRGRNWRSNGCHCDWGVRAFSCVSEGKK